MNCVELGYNTVCFHIQKWQSFRVLGSEGGGFGHAATAGKNTGKGIAHVSIGI